MKIIFKTAIVTLVSSTIILTGCTSTNSYTGENQVNDTSIGTGIGAAGGAIVGALLGGGRGAVIGGGLGAATGGLIGHSLDNENAELRRRLVGTGVQIRKESNSVQLVMASDVTFATNLDDIKSSFYPTLNSVAIVLKKYADTSITITGYTDSSGSVAYNQQLSERRARSVGDYLISQGISANRIFTQGMGHRYPVATNNTNAGRALNRRVMITLRPLK